MAVQLVDNFDLSSKKPLDSRAYWETLAALQANRTILMPDGFLAYVKDKKCYYIMNCTNPADPSTYTWSEFKTGSSSSGSGGTSTTGPTYTAGDNVQISSDNKISATDTKYTLTADKDNPMKIDLTNTAKADDKQSVEIPIHYTGVEGYPTPVGTIIAFGGKTPPQNYIACDGAELKIADYPELATWVTAQFGKVNYFGGDGTTTFVGYANLQGEFLRGTGANSHENQGSGADVGVHQDATEMPRMTNANDTNGSLVLYPTNGIDKWSNIKNYDTLYKNSEQGTGFIASASYTPASTSPNAMTSRPTNTSVLYCIKYRSDTVLNNVYSTDETVIGRWIDGKPIYRKVSDAISVNGVNADQFLTLPFKIDDIENIIHTSIIDNGMYMPVGSWINTDKTISIDFTLTFTSIRNYRVLLEYTKTTDDANTIPAGSHPSTYTEYSTVATDEEVEAALA